MIEGNIPCVGKVGKSDPIAPLERRRSRAHFPGSGKAGKLMTTFDDDELEEFIQDWHWNKKSHGFARETAAFLFEFIDSLVDTGLSQRTIAKHIDNCWSIGILECLYGYHDTFSPDIFLDEEPSHLYEFKRRYSDSKYAIASYRATCRKLAKYVKSLGYTDEDE